MNETIRTKGVSHAIQTEHITLTLVRITMAWAGNKVISFKHWFQPWRSYVTLIKVSYWTHLNQRIQYYIQQENQSHKFDTKKSKISLIWFFIFCFITFFIIIFIVNIKNYALMRIDIVRCETILFRIINKKAKKIGILIAQIYKMYSNKLNAKPQ